MRIYLAWYQDEKSCAIMDVTKVVEDAHALAPQLERGMIMLALLDLMKADEVITADSEEEMMSMFNSVTYVEDRRKELH
jgi:hypothetical protein